MSAPLPLRLAVAGAGGRVGSLLLALIRDTPDLHLAGALHKTDAALPPDADVLVDFSSPAGFRDWLDRCRDAKIPFVSGTTGLDADDVSRLDAAARVIPVLHANNTSLGVHVLDRLVRAAALLLDGHDFDVELVEMHHRHKKDAPSGTAKTLLDTILDATGRDPSAVDSGRDGHGPRRPGSVGVHAVRMGDVVGEHAVHFAGEGERLTLVHAATGRSTFAAGALRCARWIATRPAGRYGVGDVFGL